MTDNDTRIGFIGGGNMAHAIAGGLLNAGHRASCLHVSDPSEEQLRRIKRLHADIGTGSDNAAALRNADVLVLAVKPQILQEVARALHDEPRPDGQLLLSIAAGVTLAALAAEMAPSRSIVRVMPNQPALVGAGMAVLTATPETSARQRALAQYVAESTGRAEWIDDESLMDAVTAVSGSGPAYFYLLMELIELSALELGLPHPLARVLARQTAFGAGRVAVESDLELSALRESVTSKGGTTAAALAAFDAAGIRDIVGRALKAARDRSVELGAEASQTRRESD
ncbi:MAG: pyrroline-5-carboxylate reductase [Gammaproteobacteria bacterium]